MLLAFQATLQVEPADKLLSVALRVILVKDPISIQGSECEEAVNLLLRKALLFKLLYFRLRWEFLSWCHGWAPFSQSYREPVSRPAVPVLYSSISTRRVTSTDGEPDRANIAIHLPDPVGASLSRTRSTISPDRPRYSAGSSSFARTARSREAAISSFSASRSSND